MRSLRWLLVIAAVVVAGCGTASPLEPSFSLQEEPDKTTVTLTTSAGAVPINLPKSQAGPGYHGTGQESGSQTINGQTVSYEIKYEQMGDRLTITSLIINGTQLVESATAQPAPTATDGAAADQPDWSTMPVGAVSVPAAEKKNPPPQSKPATAPEGEILAELSDAKSTLQRAKRYFTVKYRFLNGRPRGGGALYWVVESASGERAHREIHSFELRDEGTLSGQIVFNRYDAPFTSYLEFGTHNPAGRRPRVTQVVAFEEPPAPEPGLPGPRGPRGPIGPRR